MNYKIKELHKLITTLKDEGLSDYGVILLEGYAVSLEDELSKLSQHDVIKNEVSVCGGCSGTYFDQNTQRTEICLAHSRL